jgi:hypothetical protein
MAPEEPPARDAAPLSSHTELALAPPDHAASSELRERAADRRLDVGARYLAVRGLERRGEVSADDALDLVLHAGASRQDRLLAVNALAVLARDPGGGPALERCASQAPTEELRRAARTFLAHQRTGRDGRAAH